ncbi:Contactin-associated protein-like 5 [Liparis tanakae]|uniref:Contactin-associated protein-like 5 n=1 Tax=Liparis tanakae TaxID=230148 RepID=A0A4Z2H6N4_9TELE|nr:Contactin-associated protein-like 5 [Liparis tanakae]
MDCVTSMDRSLLPFPSQLSFGGIPLPGKPGTFLRKNFHGCMENLYYNGINIRVEAIFSASPSGNTITAFKGTEM